MRQSLEEKLIFQDINDIMQDYTSIQPDIDDQRVKAACLLAQNVDIKRLIGQNNIDRCLNPTTDFENELVEKIEPPICYYTYARLLNSFQGSYSESGYSVEELALATAETKRLSNEIRSIAEEYMKEVLILLKDESDTDDDSDIHDDKLVSSIHVMGGRESRASN